MIATRLKLALLLIPFGLFPGCRESGSDLAAVAPQPDPVYGQMGCLFGLCDAPVPADSAGMAALAAKVGDSARALGMAWLAGPGAGLSASTPRPDTFQWIQADKIGFSLHLGQLGLYPRLDVMVKVSGTGGDLTVRSTARVGQRKSLAGFPAVGRLDYEGVGLNLAGTTEIYGPMLVWRGDVGYSSHYDNRYTGSTRNPVVWKSENPIWKNLPFTFPGATGWFAAQDTLLGAADPAGAQHQDSWYATRVLAGGTELKDTLVSDVRLVSKGKITFGKGCVIRDCIVIAGEAAIEEDANIGNSLVYGRDRLRVTGSPGLTGQFLSRDSIYLNTQSPFTGYPVFYAHGDPRKYGGRLHAEKASGETILLYGGARNVVNDNSVHLVTGINVNIKGLIYANGNATVAGTIIGSVLCSKPIWMSRGGSTYVGFIMDALHYPPDTTALLPWPLVLDAPVPGILSASHSNSFRAR